MIGHQGVVSRVIGHVSCVLHIADDGFFLDYIGLNPTNKQGAIGKQGLGLWRRGGDLHRRLVIPPEFRNAIDLDIDIRDVGARVAGVDVVLNIPLHARDRQSQRAVNFKPMSVERLD
jgi:hypothetical protein